MNIEIKRLCKSYDGHTVLSDIDIELHNGIYGLLGQNGVGKTTLIKILMKLIVDYKGDILTDGVNIRKYKDEYFHKIGYLPQYPQFYKNFTAQELILYIGTLKGMDRHTVLDRMEELFEKTNISRYRHQKIGGFSGGMRQRLGICQALLNDPELVIFDEPTAGLDPIERMNFKNLISGISENKIVILSTHIVEDLTAIASEIILLSNGRVAISGAPDVLTESIRGHVNEREIAYSEYDEFMSRTANISSVVNNGSGYTLRYVTDNSDNDTNIIPNMDEVFIYYAMMRKQR